VHKVLLGCPNQRETPNCGCHCANLVSFLCITPTSHTSSVHVLLLQVDEPALREGLPLKKDKWDAYLGWAVDAFRCKHVHTRGGGGGGGGPWACGCTLTLVGKEECVCVCVVGVELEDAKWWLALFALGWGLSWGGGGGSHCTWAMSYC